ncbi:hemerythrin domain-containing protein [Rhodocyclaceae bacterium]
MAALTEPLQHHHKHCDDLFADAEAEALGGNWLRAQESLTRFASEIECHFSTEEQLLFPAFEATTGMTLGPTQMMRLEHAQMRELIGQMQTALAAQDRVGFGGAAETLLILMQQHNMKEENILYPMCDRSLAPQEAVLGPQLQDRIELACQMA